EDVVDLAQLLHRLEQAAHVEDERHEDAELYLVVQDPIAAEQEHGEQHDLAEQTRSRTVDGLDPNRVHVCVAIPAIDVVEDLLVARLTPEGVDRTDAAERLGELDVDERHRFTYAPVQ